MVVAVLHQGEEAAATGEAAAQSREEVEEGPSLEEAGVEDQT